MKIIGTHDDATINQLKTCLAAEEGAKGVLCADGHKGYSQPIGGVVGYKKHVSVSGVGYDIACGNMAVRTSVFGEDISDMDWQRIAREIQSRISFGMGRKNNEPIESPVFDLIDKSPVAGQRALLGSARTQLGTVGAGNHYVDVFLDATNRVWVGVHFGSRGFGHKTATGFMSIAQGGKFDEKARDGEMDSPPILLDVATPSGQDYLAAMEIAGAYAYAGREAVVGKVLEILGAVSDFTVHNHHNFTWKEKHGDELLYVVRKGATPAFPGQLGFVGGSMGDISVILEGIDGEESAENLYSTVHGAGRVMSRTQAAGKQVWTKGHWSCGNYRNCPFTAEASAFKIGQQNKCPSCDGKLIWNKKRMSRKAGGLVDFEAEKLRLKESGIILMGAGADEAPPVYRPLSSVLTAHARSIQIKHILRPKVVVMAGPETEDPYKD